MAKAEKIYDIAEKLGYEGATGGNTSDAINACADALGFVGPHARRITDALSDLYTVVSGGGGGGDLGPLQPCPMFADAAPAVGETPDEYDGAFYSFSVGDQTVATATNPESGIMAVNSEVAAGVTIVVTMYGVGIGSKVVTKAAGKYATVTNGPAITKTASAHEGYYDCSFTMPTLGDGELLVLYGDS